jgi:acetoin utilization deacetylase AcuC-like enzyme
MGKFRALHEQLLADGLVDRAEVVAPEEAPRDDLALVHTSAYLEALETSSLSREAERRLGLPANPALWRRSRLAVQGTVLAARHALADGVAANLAGGTHHAFADRGEGFCVLNDVAVAIRSLRRDGRMERALVVDLDVHQGNGTAAIFADDPATYTFSMHGEKNFPFEKETSSRDVELPDGMEDAAYLDLLLEHLPEVLGEARADLVFYLAGVDPVAGDRFGRLALSPAGVARRDRAVLEHTRDAGVPTALLLSGGYGPDASSTAALHAIAHREARRVFGVVSAGSGADPLPASAREQEPV